MIDAPEFTVTDDPPKRTIVVRMKGTFNETAMNAFAAEYKQVTDRYGGGAHLVFADMRGMTPASPAAAELFGKAIGYARSRGVACCAHLSDSTVLRLQARRVARANSPGDDVTIDVVSEVEAEKLLAEKREKLTKSSGKR